MNRPLLWTALSLALLAASPAMAQAELPQAQRLLAEGKPAEALALLDTYLGYAPQDTEARVARGVALARLDRQAEAIRVFTDLSHENPLLMEPYRQLGSIYLQQGDYLKAREALETVANRAPDDVATLASLGDVNLALAGRAYNRALLGSPDNATLRGKQRGVERLLAGEYPNTDMVIEPALAAPTPLGAPALTATNIAAAPFSGGATTAGTDPGGTPDEVLKLLNAWLAAWSSQDVDAYLGYYADSFHPEIENNREAWAQGRRNTISAAHGLRVSASAPRLSLIDATHARLRFEQRYRADLYEGRSIKTLDLVKTDKGWQIARERVESD